jgi:hypothetical protein
MGNGRIIKVNFAKALARRKAKAMKADLLYRYMRDELGLGAGEAMATVKTYDSLTADLTQDNKETA